MAVSGGFLQVNDNRVEVLTDAAERAEEIDLQRAEEARRRAEPRWPNCPRGSELRSTQWRPRFVDRWPG